MASSTSGQWRPTASRFALEARARMLGDIRQFFSDRDILEVETPTLSAAGNSDPNINVMAVDGCPTPYLRTSPEYALKRLLAAGVGDIYELGRVYRASESGPMHNPEFTLLEWYRVGWQYLSLAAEVIELLEHCGHGHFRGWPRQFRTYRELFLEVIGVDPLHCDESELALCAADRGIHSEALNHQQWLDLLMAEVIQPQFEGEIFTIVHEFPPEQAALARITCGPDPVAQRFEIFAGPVELANGYQELDDAVEQERRFERESSLRSLRGEDSAPIDRRLIAALESGLPECTGVAVGVDRMLMLLLGVDHIQMVLSFASDRA